ncbi:MAG: translation initiation factor [Porphyromonadaceae bacterium]|nr:translation initiation factor [Porphyromonadaceae bacterium]
MSDWKNRLGVLYSTNPDFEYTTAEVAEPETLPADEQRLRLSLSKKQRGGKEVTLITGFIGSSVDLEALGKTLRQRCGVGGSAKDGEIIIQGDQRQKLLTILPSLGYTKTK